MDAVGGSNVVSEEIARELLDEWFRSGPTWSMDEWSEFVKRAHKVAEQVPDDRSLVALLVEWHRYAEAWTREEFVSFTDRLRAALYPAARSPTLRVALESAYDVAPRPRTGRKA